MAAGACEEQHAESIGPCIGRGKGRQVPSIAQRLAIGGPERQRIATAWLEIARVELPELTAGVVHAAADRDRADSQARHAGERARERRFNQDAGVADRRQQVPDLPTIPG